MKLVVNKETKIKSVILDSEFYSDKYEDLSYKIEHWYYYGLKEELTDYLIVRDNIKSLTESQGFDNIKEDGKNIVCELCAAPAETIVMSYMMSGMSQNEAIAYYKKRRGTDVRNASIVCGQRIMSDSYTTALISYLNEEDAQAFLDATRNFGLDYKNAAVMGTNYGDIVNGIMDYIESTGDYSSGGLKNYTILSPFTLADCVQELKNILVYGNY